MYILLHEGEAYNALIKWSYGGRVRPLLLHVRMLSEHLIER